MDGHQCPSRSGPSAKMAALFAGSSWCRLPRWTARSLWRLAQRSVRIARFPRRPSFCHFAGEAKSRLSRPLCAPPRGTFVSSGPETGSPARGPNASPVGWPANCWREAHREPNFRPSSRRTGLCTATGHARGYQKWPFWPRAPIVPKSSRCPHLTTCPHTRPPLRAPQRGPARRWSESQSPWQGRCARLRTHGQARAVRRRPPGPRGR